MVLVDSSVWIELLQNPESPWASRLAELIAGHNRAAICGIVLQEVLQGIRDAEAYALTRERLCRLPFVNATKESSLLAADIYRQLRVRGITVPSTDAAIAALAITNQMELFSKDRHFAAIAAHTDLVIHQIE